MVIVTNCWLKWPLYLFTSHSETHQCKRPPSGLTLSNAAHQRYNLIIYEWWSSCRASCSIVREETSNHIVLFCWFVLGFFKQTFETDVGVYTISVCCKSNYRKWRFLNILSLQKYLIYLIGVQLYVSIECECWNIAGKKIHLRWSLYQHTVCLCILWGFLQLDFYESFISGWTLECCVGCRNLKFFKFFSFLFQLAELVFSCKTVLQIQVLYLHAKWIGSSSILMTEFRHLLPENHNIEIFQCFN